MRKVQAQTRSDALAMAKNPSTSGQELHSIACSAYMNVEIGFAILENPNLEERTADLLWENERFRPTVLQLPVVSDTLVLKSATSPKLEEQRAVCEREHLPIEAQQALLKSTWPGVKFFLAFRSDLDPTVATKLARSPLVDVVRAVASNDALPIKERRALANHREVRVRLELLTNPNQALEVIDLLATDKEARVRRGVVTHPQSREEQVDRVAKAKGNNEDVVITILGSPYASPELLKSYEGALMPRELGLGSFQCIRWIARHERTPREVKGHILSKMVEANANSSYMGDHEAQVLDVVIALAKNTETDDAMLGHILEVFSSSVDVRKAVAANSNLSNEGWIELLLQDDEPDVQRAALLRSKKPAMQVFSAFMP